MSNFTEASSDNKSTHQRQVEEFMRLAGQSVPGAPQYSISEAERVLRARLILEEAMETVEALGVDILQFPDTPSGRLTFSGLMLMVSETSEFDLVEVIDGCCDIAVVTIGTLSACGVPDLPFQELVNQNNLAKVGPGHSIREDGKLIKPPGHKPPDIAGLLSDIESECDSFVIIDEPILPEPLSQDE